LRPASLGDEVYTPSPRRSEGRRDQLGGAVRAAPRAKPRDQVVALVTTVPEVKEEELGKWLDSVYAQIGMSQDDLLKIYQALAYQGFNREDVLKQMRSIMPDPKLVSQAILAVALRGPQQGSLQKLSNGRSLSEMGIPASGGKGNKKLTCNKIQSATADLAAAFMKRLNVPKRLNLPCPGWLQFPSAGSIKLPIELREQHIEFARQFSVAIGGGFQEQIYLQMAANAYLDPKLKLFD